MRQVFPPLSGIAHAVIAALLIAIEPLAQGAEPAATKVAADVPYSQLSDPGDYEKERCKLDLYAPAGAKNLPCVVWFHGGGLTGGDKSGGKTEAGCRALASEGLLVAAVNYRLSPKAKYPAYVEDGASAIAWLVKHAAEHGGNPDRIFVAGHSAGAYLAALVTLNPSFLASRGVTSAKIAGVIPIAGQTVTHFTIREERALPKSTIIVDESAPIHHVRAEAPPFLVLYAEKDMALREEENRYFAAAMKAAGHRDVTIHEVAGHDHGGIGERLHEEGSPVRKMMLEFITRLAGPR